MRGLDGANNTNVCLCVCWNFATCFSGLVSPPGDQWTNSSQSVRFRRDASECKSIWSGQWLLNLMFWSSSVSVSIPVCCKTMLLFMRSIAILQFNVYVSLVEDDAAVAVGMMGAATNPNNSAWLVMLERCNHEDHDARWHRHRPDGLRASMGQAGGNDQCWHWTLAQRMELLWSGSGRSVNLGWIVVGVFSLAREEGG